DPANELAHYGLGDVLRLRGDLEAAAKEYSACASRNSRSYACQESVREYGFAGLGEADANKRRQEYFNKLLKDDPANTVLYLEAALSLAATQQYGKMGVALEKGLSAVRKAGDRDLETILLGNLIYWRA